MPNYRRLKVLLDDFDATARPSKNRDDSEPCTIKDLNKSITRLVNLMNEFIRELEKQER